MATCMILLLWLVLNAEPSAPPSFVWTGPNTGRVTFAGPGVLEKRSLNGYISRVYQADAETVTVDIPARAPADLMDRPQVGDVFCVADLCSAPVQPRGTLYLPIVEG